MDVLFRGILFGLILSVLLGPIFVVIINTAIQHGRRAGIISCLGVWISDALFIVASYFFMNRLNMLMKGDSFKFWLAIIGGLLFCGMGVFYLMKKNTIDHETFEKKIKSKNDIGFFMSGFMVNTINPFTVFFWMTTMSTEVFNNNLSTADAGTFLIGILLMIVITDIIKVNLSGYIGKKMKPTVFQLFSKVAGIILLLIGVYFLYYGYSL